MRYSYFYREKREPTPGEGVGNNGIQMVQYAMPERGTLKSLSAQPPSPNDSLSRSPRYRDLFKIINIIQFRA